MLKLAINLKILHYHVFAFSYRNFLAQDFSVFVEI